MSLLKYEVNNIGIDQDRRAHSVTSVKAGPRVLYLCNKESESSVLA